MGLNLSEEDIKEFKKQGYSDEEINKAINEVEKEELEKTSQSSDQSVGTTSPSTTSSFSQRNVMSDIAMHQLELNDLLEQTEHVLKGDVIVIENGQKKWKDNPHPEKNPLNKEGIRKIMLELQNYINRHIVLGDYEENDINVIMKNYGKKLTNLIFMKYEEMGMDTEEKRQEYESLVMNIVNLVYASYSRAKGGGERRSLREMINVSQNYQSQATGGENQPPKQRGILDPTRWMKGKYG